MSTSSDTWRKHFIQTADISLGGCEFSPIGAVSNAAVSNAPDTVFAGSYNGGGHTITGLKVLTLNSAGMFGWVNGASISDLTLENVNVESTGNNQQATGGLVAGVGHSTSSSLTIVSRVSVSGSVKGMNKVGGVIGDALETQDQGQTHSITDVHMLSGIVQGKDNVGGVVGDTAASFSDSSSGVGVAVSGENFVGGFAGNMDAGEITDSQSGASVSSSDWAGGGFVGGKYGGNIENSHASGDVSVVGAGGSGGFVGDHGWGGVIDSSSASGDVLLDVGSYGYAGGFAGSVFNGSEIRASFATGDVIVDVIVEGQAERVGGFVGNHSDGVVSSSYSSGVVSAAVSTRVGGFAGDVGSNGTIDDSFSVGDTTGKEQVGGFAGQNQGTITDSYSTGAVQGTSATTTRGFVGDITGGTITDSFWDSDTSGLTPAGDDSTAKTTALMTSLTTFSATWSITSATAFGFERTGSTFVWGIGSGLNCGYPFLYWQTESAASCVGGSSNNSSGGSFVSTPVVPTDSLKKVVRMKKVSDNKVSLPARAKRELRTNVRSLTSVTTAVCTGFVSNPRVASFTKKQARERAVRACNIVKRLQPAAEVRTRVVVVDDAKVPRLRSVRVVLTGR